MHSGNSVIKLFKRINSYEYGRMAIKNSAYDFLSSSVAKIGSLFFTIILARMLMPELFGLYNLVMSTILLIGSLAVLGVNQTLIKFVSEEIKEKKGNSREIILYLWKIRLFILGVTLLIILFSAHFISSEIYRKSITIALMGGIFFLAFMNFSSFLESVLYSLNRVDIAFHKEILFQLIRMVLVFFGIFMTMNYSNDLRLFFIFVLLGVSYLFSDLYMFSFLKREPLLKKTKDKLGREKKKKLKNFFFLNSTVLLSGIFFSYIDKIMLGYYVRAEFIGYYSAAFGMVSSMAILGSFGTALLPIFSRIDKGTLKNALGKSLKFSFLFSLLLLLFTLVISKYLILLAYGKEYYLSVGILNALSIIIILLPASSILLSYFLSMEKQNLVSKLLLITTMINVVLNFALIKYLLPFGDLAAVYGVCAATIISQVCYLSALYYNSRKE